MSIKISWRFICSSIKTKIWEPFAKCLFLKRQIIRTMDDRNYSCLCFHSDWYKYISILHNNQKDITLVIFKRFDVLMNFELFNFDQSTPLTQWFSHYKYIYTLISNGREKIISWNNARSVYFLNIFFFLYAMVSV